MRTDKMIPLFWWSEKKFILKDRENYGDLLSKYLVEKISGKEVKWVHPRKQPWYKLDKTNYLAAGSILHHATKNSIVWGSGIIDRKQVIPDACYKAVRGPLTRDLIVKSGYECPESYGDPALLLPQYFNPKAEKRWKLGIIPHYHDFEKVDSWYRNEEDIHVINVMTNDIEEVTRAILKCERTVSSSLHGIIVSHAYNIPSLWVEFSTKLFGDGVKFQDYFESIEIEFYKAPFLENKIDLVSLAGIMEKYPLLPGPGIISRLQESLLKTCPFKS